MKTSNDLLGRAHKSHELNGTPLEIYLVQTWLSKRLSVVAQY